MDWLESAAFAWLLPAGCTKEPIERLGLASLTCEMVQRGCGSRNSRQFVEDLDRLGVDRSASVSGAHTSFGGSMLADNLGAALAIFADLVRAPRLPAEQLEDGRQVCLQELWALEDDLAQKTMWRLKQRHYGDPWGRSPHGSEPTLEQITLDEIRGHVQRTYQPQGTILSVAGKVDWSQLLETIEQLLGDWAGDEPAVVEQTPPPRGYEHVSFSSSQTQIGVAFDSVPYSHPDYFQARGAVGVLSDGMSSRLFTEVREKRGLCYTVYASCHSLRDRGSVLTYAGTSTERAQETLDVLLSELTQLGEGVQPDELQRLKARIKSTLIMQQESSAARCASMAADWYHLGRVWTLDELGQIIDALSCSSINRYLRSSPPQDFTVVTLGAEELEVPRAVS
jgi:predicted Zn-dependent peptidase